MCWIKERICDDFTIVCYPAFMTCLASPWHLPERDQVNTSFNTLYTSARKLEVKQPLHSQKSGSGSTDLHRDKYRRYPTPNRRVATLEEEELFLPDLESHKLEMPKFDQIEGLSMCMTQAMDHFQCKEHKCFVCGESDHFVRDCLHQETFCKWHKEHLNSQEVGPNNKEAPTPKNPPPK